MKRSFLFATIMMVLALCYAQNPSYTTVYKNKNIRVSCSDTTNLSKLEIRNGMPVFVSKEGTPIDTSLLLEYRCGYVGKVDYTEIAGMGHCSAIQFLDFSIDLKSKKVYYSGLWYFDPASKTRIRIADFTLTFL